MDSERFEQMTAFLRAVADPKRLRLLGILAEGPKAPSDLASGIGQSLGGITRDLGLLKGAGLAREGSDRMLTLDLDPLRQLLREARSPGNAEGAADAGVPQPPRGLLRRFFDGPRLRTFPSKRMDKDLVLEEILRRLPRQEEYAESDLNVLLKEIHPDYATLRREMVDAGYMSRAAGIYRLTEKGKRAQPERDRDHP